LAGLSVTKILKVITEVRARADAAPRFCLVGEGFALRDAAAALSAGAPDAIGGVSAGFDVLAPGDVPRDATLRRWHALAVVADGCEGAVAAPVVTAARAHGVAVVGVLPGRDTPTGTAWLASSGIRHGECAVSLGLPGEAKPTLAGRLADVLGDDGIAVAKGLPALRRAVADHIVLTTARQNGVIGVVIVIPGADMPAMTLNQIRMVLRIAAAYGEELGLDRALEILSVAGAGLVFRTLARQALDFVPGFGWAVKGAVGFSGTVALGSAAIEYFEAGAPLTPARFTKLADTVDRLRKALPFRGVAAG
jgi:uncharacterized protein (DUF697 family)